MVVPGAFILRLWLALVLALGIAAPAAANVPVETCVAPLSSNGSPTPQFDCRKDQTRYGGGDFAVQLRFQPVISSAENPLMLRHTSVWQERERVVFSYADGTTSSLEFDSISARKYMTIGAIFEFRVPPRDAPLTGIYIETGGSANWRGVVLGAQLVSQSESFRLQSWLVALYAGFGGLALALLAYNLALWQALRHRFQLTYAAMVGLMAAYTFSASSLIMVFVPWLENNDRLRLNYVLLTLTGLAGLRFIVEFFGPKTFSARLRQIMGAFAVWSLCITLAFAVFAPWLGQLLDRLYFINGAVLVGFLVPIGIAAWRARVRHFWLFLATWSPPVMVTALRIAHGLGLVGYSFWLDNSNLIALAIESLLSTLLIVARLRDLATERDTAREGEVTALRLANSDPLTGLLNRRSFLDLAIGKASRQRLMLIDIDKFKVINDRYGHDTGDRVLREVAKAIQSVRPAESLAVRLGGEEFALLVPEERTFLCTPELVLEAVRCQTIPFGAPVTISLGYAEGAMASEADWKRLYRLADSALLRAKNDGRDRACRSTDFSLPTAARA